MVVVAGAAGAAGAGLAYGVEEFVFLALVVAVVVGLGTVTAWSRQRVIRRAVQVVVTVPLAEVTAGQSALVELTVTNGGRRRLPPVLVEDPSAHWSISHPGLGETSVGGGRRPPSAPARRASGFTSLGQRSPSADWLGN